MNTFKMQRLIWRNPWTFIACGFGIGTLPLMPGTYATLTSVALYLVLVKLPLIAYLVIIFILNAVGVWLCAKVNHAFGTDDHPAAVWDEIASFPIVMITVPCTWYYLLLGIILFRVFDIWKPGPIGWVDKNIHGGLGVMLDDVLAAVASWAILQIIIFIAT